MLALVLTLFVAAPSLDLVICHGDEATASASHDGYVAAADSRDAGRDHGSGPCPHGHVHSIACEAATPAEASAPVVEVTRRLVPRHKVASLWQTSGQDRPPRV
jgi:hypothetical protein